MRITASANYWHEFECNLSDCNRQYCAIHRLLWRECETAKEGLEGDSEVPGGLNKVIELGDCPACEAEGRRRRLYQELTRRNPHSSICPECFQMSGKPDDTAIHLVDTHEWLYEKARLWLLGEVERRGVE